MINIIFTDIDGVLNPHWKTKWSKSAVALYNKVCKEYDLKPVITSTWRTNPSIDLDKVFIEQGIEVKIYGYTPQLEQKERGIEIKEWLDNNQCDNYVVIDDSVGGIVPYVNNVVKCRSWLGFTIEEYNEIVKILEHVYIKK